MLTVFLTLAFALYVLGPDLVFRWIVGWAAPSRFRKRTYGEQITTACLLCVIPDFIAWEITRHAFHVYSPSNKVLLLSFFDGLVSQNGIDRTTAPQFHTAVQYLWLVNLFTFSVVYSFVGAAAIIFARVLRQYGRLLRKYATKRWRREIITALVRPWTAEWHLRLSPMLLPTKDTIIQLDVLTKPDILFRGTLVEHHLGADGALVTVTLMEAQKYKRQELLDDRSQLAKMDKAESGFLKLKRKTANAESYWGKPIGNTFVVSAAEILTLNIRYVEKEANQLDHLALATTELKHLLDQINLQREKESDVVTRKTSFTRSNEVQGLSIAASARPSLRRSRSRSPRGTSDKKPGDAT